MKKLNTFFRSAAMFSCIAAAVIGCRSAAPNVKESGTTFAKDALMPFVENGQLPGAINVFYKDGVQETSCVGYADPVTKRPITMDDVFMQCSQTKGFCGVTIAMLVEDGKISLDDPVSKYLPEFKELWVLKSNKDGVKTLVKAKNTLTIRMVMNHTGGFPFEINAKSSAYRGGGWTAVSLRQTAFIAAHSPILFEPGTGVQYSNTGIDIGAAIVEVVTGKTWDAFLQERLFDPLEMNSTSFKPTCKQLETKIDLYRCVKDKPAAIVEYNANIQEPYNGPNVHPSAGAGLWTTANDQLKFYKMLMNLGIGDNGVRILKEETVKNLLAVSTRPETVKGGYSLGLSAPVKDNENAWFGHGGAWGTTCSVNWHRKELKLWIVQLIGSPRPWDAKRVQAEKDFFKYVIDNNSLNAYTGRTN